ncbi:MAG: hypothetical protein ACXWQO_04660 [Bdellovibrionota bacterium]
MKKLTLAMLAGLLATFGVAQANSDTDALVRQIALSQLTGPGALNVINWKVGEFGDMNIEGFGMPLGTIHKFVASEEGNFIWFQQDMAGSLIGNHKVEAKMDRATAKIVELKQDGKAQEIPDGKLEIISQDSASITVPAGTFESIHIVAKDSKGQQMEVWMNPRDITLDGAAQEIIKGQITMTLKLTKQGGR